MYAVVSLFRTNVYVSKLFSLFQTFQLLLGSTIMAIAVL